MTPFTMELMPTNGRKSFYGKCLVRFEDDCSQTLLSYGTEIMRRFPDGSMVRFRWNVEAKDWTPTTGIHIKTFCGLNKKEYMALPLA